jgi:hypothetical protein
MQNGVWKEALSTALKAEKNTTRKSYDYSVITSLIDDSVHWHFHDMFK